MGANARAQMWLAWAGPIATVGWLAGFGAIAGFIPPPSPADSAAEVQAMYADDADMIRLGLFVTMMAATLLGPFTVAIFLQMKRIEGERAPLAYTQLGLGVLVVLLFIVPCFMMETAAFRPDRDPETIQALHDAGWLPFVGAYMPTFFQLLAIGACILIYDQRVFPRWLGYFNIWVAFLLIPAGMIFWWKTGPFAWNGVMAFWMVAAVFCGWFILMFLQLRRAIKDEAAEAAPA